MKVRLGDVFNRQITGEWGSECIASEKGIKVLRTTNFTFDGQIDFKDVVLRDINTAKAKEKRLRSGDILLEKSGGTEKTPVGRVVFCDESIERDIFLCNNFTQAMRVNPEIAFSRYVFYFMWYFHNSKGTELLQNKTTGIRNLQIKSYLNIEIPLPSLEEQRHIAAVLDKVSELISKRKAQLDKLDELVKSRFVEMFGDPIENSMGWPVYKLSELSTLITNGNTPKGGSENYISEGIIFLRSQNIWRNYLDLSEVAYIDRATHEMMKKSSVHCNDILITKTGRINTENSSLGRAAIFTGADNSANINGHVYLVRLGDKVLPLYILSILTSEAYRKYIRKVCVGGIDKRQINLDQVESFPIIKPPIETQTQFVQLYQQTEKVKMSVQKSLDQLETLKKALMQKYFG